MKATVVLAVVAALVAVAYGAPGSHIAPKWNPKLVETTFNSIKTNGVPTSNPVIDWARTGVLAADLRMVFNTTATTVAKLAFEANPSYGSEIAYIAYRDQRIIDLVMFRMQQDIREKTLNGGQVVLYMGEVTFRFVTSALEIEPLLVRLGKNEGDEIRSVFEEAMEYTDELVEKLFDMFEIESRTKMD